MSWLTWPWYFVCKVYSTNRLFLLKNAFRTLCLRGWKFHAVPCLIVISFKVPLLRSSFKSDSWRRCTCTNVLLVCEGEVGVMSCHSCHGFMGFGQAEEKRCGGCLKDISWSWRSKPQKVGSFHREGRLSLCNTAVLWSFIGSLTGYIQ